ncbi:MAG: sigma 54-interacting transcriptional regulator [Deltaproteobacteria bacterium]|nr:sigma 54-interacting transcriptional regulator [Deltaproteobacteria bacterium]MCL5792065.1 sigma 54-interacting transcriptional regulator [Deltaproteobacteria bacterium]
MKLQNAQCPKSDTGRKVAARAIHSAGNRKKGSFVAINCTAIPV